MSPSQSPGSETGWTCKSFWYFRPKRRQLSGRWRCPPGRAGLPSPVSDTGHPHPSLCQRQRDNRGLLCGRAGPGRAEGTRAPEPHTGTWSSTRAPPAPRSGLGSLPCPPRSSAGRAVPGGRSRAPGTGLRYRVKAPALGYRVRAVRLPFPPSGAACPGPAGRGLRRGHGLYPRFISAVDIHDLYPPLVPAVYSAATAPPAARRGGRSPELRTAPSNTTPHHTTVLSSAPHRSAPLHSGCPLSCPSFRPQRPRRSAERVQKRRRARGRAAGPGQH